MTDPRQLHALADEELNGLEATQLREALKHDPQMAAEFDAILNLKDILENRSVRHTNEDAWRSCVVRLDAIDKTKRVEGFVGRYAWLMCGALFLFIVSGRYAMRNVQGDAARTADLARVFGSSRSVSPETAAQMKMYQNVISSIGNSLDRKEIQIFPTRYGTVHDLAVACTPIRDRVGDLVLTQVNGTLTLQDTAPMPNNPSVEAGGDRKTSWMVWHQDGQTLILKGDRSIDELNDFSAHFFGLR